MVAQAPLLTTQAVGNFFVEKYYNVLYQSPELLYHFYHAGSKLVRPNADGDMCSDTTLEAIKQKIHLTGNTVMVDIKTVDSHKAYDGILVIVRGYLTGADNLKRRFTQTFFLAPQERGYYVLNDILRYDDDDDDQKEETAWEDDYVKVLVGDDAETTEDNNTDLVWEGAVLVCEGEKLMIDEVEDDYIIVSVAGDEKEETHTNITISNSSVAPVAAATIQEEAPKKSYAAVVKAMRDNPAPVMVRQKAPTLFAVA